MKPESNTWPSVEWFAKQMEGKLVENAHKGGPEGWLNRDVLALERMLKDEIVELRGAISSGNPSSVIREAADVANFAMMIATWYNVRHNETLAEIDDTP